jgi:O-antigen/teichoic acid export membrane protein
MPRVPSVTASATPAWSLRSAVTTCLIYGTSVVIGYFFNITIARWCGVREYGAFTIVWNLVAFLMVPAALGSSVSALRYIPHYERHEDHASLAGFLSFAVGAVLFSTSAVAVLAVTVRAAGLLSEESDLARMALPASFLLIGAGLGNLLQELARAGGNAWMTIVPQQIGRPLLALALLMSLSVPARATGAACVVAVSGAAMVVILFQAAYLHRRYRGCWRAGLRLRLREWLPTSLELCAYNAVVTGLMVIDTLFAGLLLGPREAGIFGVAFRVALVVELPFVAVNTLAVPGLARLLAGKETAQLQHTMARISHAMFWPGLAIAAGIVVFAQFVLGLFGPGFEDGRIALYWLIAARVVDTGFGPVTNIVAISGLQRRGLVVLGAAWALDVAGNILLAPRLGIVGVALAHVVNAVFRAGALHVIIERKLGLRSLVFYAPLARSGRRALRDTPDEG